MAGSVPEKIRPVKACVPASLNRRATHHKDAAGIANAPSVGLFEMGFGDPKKVRNEIYPGPKEQIRQSDRARPT
jgi:hypothetical protein